MNSPPTYLLKCDIINGWPPNKSFHYSYLFHLLIFIPDDLQKKCICISTQENFLIVNFLILDIPSLPPWMSQIQVQRLVFAPETDADPHWNLINALSIVLRIYRGPFVGCFTQKRRIKNLGNVSFKGQIKGPSICFLGTVRSMISQRSAKIFLSGSCFL